jgi:hypothetical protein
MRSSSSVSEQIIRRKGWLLTWQTRIGTSSQLPSPATKRRSCKNQGGTAEALIDGVTGLAVDPSNETELAAAFLTLLNKPEQARAMGVKAYAFVRENFDIERQTAFLERIYDSLLEQKDLLRKTL